MKITEAKRIIGTAGTLLAVLVAPFSVRAQGGQPPYAAPVQPYQRQPDQTQQQPYEQREPPQTYQREPPQTYQPQQPQTYQPQQTATVRVPIFLHAAGGAWIPMPGTFAENHKLGGALDLMGGLSLEPFLHQHLDLFIDVMFSAHELHEQAWIDEDHTKTTVMAGCLGLRWFLFAPTSIGAPYILAGAGLVYESAERNGNHAPPQPSWMTMGGAGWEVGIGSVFRIGARVTGTYLDENGARLGWIAPSLTLGGEI